MRIYIGCPIQITVDKICNISAHAVVYLSAREDNPGIMIGLKRAFSEIIRINTNAMPAHKAGGKFQKIPFCACRLQHFMR